MLNLSQKNQWANKLMSFINSNAPYATKDLIQSIQLSNPKFTEFYKLGTNRQEILQKHSIAANPFINETGNFSTASDDFFQYMYANIDPDKIKRLREYRIVASNDIIADALDNICDDFLNEEVEDEIITLEIKNEDLEKSTKDTLEQEFKKIVNYFEIEEKGWEYIRNILVDAELYFENILHKDHPDKGILGIVCIPTELIDPIFDNVQNMNIKGFLLRKQIIDQQTKQIQGVEPIVFDKHQISYFHSHIWNEKKTFRVPFIETARRAYKQLTYVEDAIVIHRLVNAPEKMVFNVDVGNMPNPKIQGYLNRLAQNYWSRKTYDTRQGNVSMFNPQSMLDAFWFPKRQGSEGTTVSRMSGNQNLGDLPDLNYFVKKIYNALHVPINRLSGDSNFSDGTDILREELRFAKLIIRLQRQFAQAIKHTFISHLRLKGYWKEFGLHEYDLKVKMKEPSHFHVMRQQQIKELEYNNYGALAGDEMISKSFLMQRELGWDDKEIIKNRAWLEKDAEYAWMISQIQAYGSDWRKIAERESEDAASNFEGGGTSGFGGSELGGGLGGGVGDDIDVDGGDTADTANNTPQQPSAQPQPSSNEVNNFGGPAQV